MLLSYIANMRYRKALQRSHNEGMQATDLSPQDQTNINEAGKQVGDAVRDALYIYIAVLLIELATLIYAIVLAHRCSASLSGGMALLNYALAFIFPIPYIIYGLIACGKKGGK